MYFIPHAMKKQVSEQKSACAKRAKGSKYSYVYTYVTIFIFNFHQIFLYCYRDIVKNSCDYWHVIGPYINFNCIAMQNMHSIVHIYVMHSIVHIYV